MIEVKKRYQLFMVDATNTYILFYITVMHRNTKLVIFNFCSLYIFSNLYEDSKNLHEIVPSLVSF